MKLEKEELKELIKENKKRNEEVKIENIKEGFLNLGKELSVPLVLVLLSVIFFNILGNKLTYEKKAEEQTYYKAIIKNVEEKVDEINIPEEAKNVLSEEEKKIYENLPKNEYEEFEAEIIKVYKNPDLEEGNKDKEHNVGNIVKGKKEYIDKDLDKSKKLEKGDKVLIVKSAVVGEDELFHFVSYDKTAKLIGFIVFFLILVILIAKTKGLNTIILLFLIGYALLKAYIPAILAGYNIYLVTMLLGIYSVVIGMMIINGFNKKTYAAILGNILGLIIAGVLAYIANKAFGISGISSEESMMLVRIGKQKFDLRGIAWAGILIGALGAIMDTALSIASSIREISKTTKEENFFILLKSGMEVGKDAISTMISTLLLAYISGTLIESLLMSTYTKPAIFLVNSEFILEEILKSIIGAIGILITVPATAALASLFEVIENKKERAGKSSI